jgi:solute:Na+ symporter, SSS family
MVQLEFLDIALIVSFFALIMFVGLYVSKSSGESSSAYFLSGRNMPWWLLGVSMVATTFSTDTPNLVTDIVRTNGVSGNWVWWAFLLTGLLTVFIYARLWRKSNVNTDIEFYELRYGGKPARFLRIFRAVYLGLFFNVLAMAAVTLAAIKIGSIILGLAPWQTVLIGGAVTVIFSTFGGFKGVVYTDFILFFVAMGGSIAAAWYLIDLPQVGGLSNLIQHDNVADKLSFFPDFSNTELLVTLLIIPLAVQWWSAWYPGAEPGGGGYIAQRMLAAKNEKHAIGATFFFNIMHYALRPWPWILVALASLVVFPDLQSIQNAFPGITPDKLGEDLAYSAMLTFLPSGLLGLLLASLAAAYMSTISTHLNWGASYLVNDCYKQYFNKTASEKQLVRVGRTATVVLLILSALLALILQNALQLFDIILMFGAGTGVIFILRWFWWRINAWSEISAMFASGVISLLINLTPVGLVLFGDNDGLFESYLKYPFVVLMTTIIWLLTMLLTRPESESVLKSFYTTTQPGGPGWKQRHKADIVNETPWSVPFGIVAMLLGSVGIYSAMFAVGSFLYGNLVTGGVLTAICVVVAALLFKLWPKISRTIAP